MYSTSCISQSSSNKQAIKSNPISGFKSRSSPLRPLTPSPPFVSPTPLQWIIQLPTFIPDNCPSSITDYPQDPSRPSLPSSPNLMTRHESNREPSPPHPPVPTIPPACRTSINPPEYNPVSIKNPRRIHVFIISVFSRQTYNEKDFVYDCTHTCGETM